MPTPITQERNEALELAEWAQEFVESVGPVNFYEVREMAQRARELGMTINPTTGMVGLDIGTVKDSIEKIRMVAMQDQRHFALVLDEVERFRLRLMASQIFKGIWHNVSYQIVR